MQLKEIRCCDVCGRSPAAAGWCCFWPRPHSRADSTAEAQLVACLFVCLSSSPPPYRPDLKPPSSITPPVAHTPNIVPLSCLTGSEVKTWMLEHPVTPTCSHRFLSVENTHTYTKECMHTAQAAMDNGTDTKSLSLLPLSVTMAGKLVFTRTTRTLITWLYFLRRCSTVGAPSFPELKRLSYNNGDHIQQELTLQINHSLS